MFLVSVKLRLPLIAYFYLTHLTIYSVKTHNSLVNITSLSQQRVF